MGHRFAMLTFTPTVTAAQGELGSARGYAAWSHPSDADSHHTLTDQEAAFIAARDSFYMASVSETGWPYVQHRGGAPGFVRVLDEKTLGFADFGGNRQYISLGNLRHDPRVSLFFMDYPNRARLKLLGRVEFIAGSDFAALARLEVEGYRATVERGMLIHVEAFDWNCSQHITPRYSERELHRGAAAAHERAPLPPLGAGPVAVEIVGVRRETPDVRVYELRHADGLPLPRFEAGAHLQVPVALPADEHVVRPFSLCSDPADSGVYCIAVQRQDAGRGGTRAVHRDFNVGTRLQLAPPVQAFPLHHDQRPSVLIAGGIGITPLRAMVHSLLRTERYVELHYAGRSRARMAFLEPLQQQLGARLRTYVSDEGQRLDAAAVLRSAPEDAVFYICGPATLVDEVLRVGASLGIESDRLRFERFGASAGAPVQLHLKQSGMVLDVAGDQPLLDAILAAGVEVPFSCRVGTCRTCAVRAVHGTPEHRDQVLTPREREDGWLCPCVSRAKTPTLELDL